MKQLTFALLWCFPVFLFGQTTDSIAIKRIDSLINVSANFNRQQKFEKAIKANDKAEKLASEKFGKESLIYAGVCAQYGYVYKYMNNIGEVESWFTKTLNICKETKSMESLVCYSCLSTFSSVYRRMGDYEKAETFGLQSLEIREKVLGKKDPNYIGVLVDFGSGYLDAGNYQKAEACFLEAKTIFETELNDRTHQFYIACIVNLGLLYVDMEKFEESERLFLDAKYIMEVTLNDRDHPFYINCLMNLSLLYGSLQIFDKYESLTLQVKGLVEQKMGKVNPTYAGILINLSTFYSEMGEYKKAEPLLLEAKEVFEVKLKMKEHPFYLACLNNLGILNNQSEKYEKAEYFYLEVLSLREKLQGREHPDYATCLNTLANNYAMMGEYEKAEPLYRQSLYILEQSLSKEHSSFINIQHNLANFLMEKGDFKNADSLFAEVTELDQSNFVKSLRYLSEEEQSAYLGKSKNFKAATFALAEQTQGKGLRISETCYDYNLFYKGFLLNANRQTKRLALSNPTTAETFNRIKSYKQSLASEYVKPLEARDSIKLVELEEESNKLEKELARTVTGYGETMRQVKWQEVQQQLKPGEAALEFSHYQYKKNIDSKTYVMYAALLLLSEEDQPKFISLFEEKQLKKILNIRHDDKTINVNTIYQNKLLHELIWHPLEKELAEIKTIYYSPSGLLHRLNLNAIPLDEKRTVGNKYNLVQVNSTRELVLPTSIENKSEEVLLFGGIQYNMDTTAITSINKGFEKTTTRGSLSFSQSDSTLRGDNWSYLDWTEVEVSAIESILEENGIPTNSQVGHRATEEAFKSINQPSPRILHIATHGFFFPDPKQETSSLAIGIEQEPVFKTSDHPMIRSGLIMAGGNHAWETGKPFQPNMEDGILTAYEISQMDLSNTELVVLSACDTGLGDIEGNEGVYGLQRAFKIAGAKYLIMSLWQVPDYQTQQLMTVFYNNWLTKKMSIPDAFRLAQKEMQAKYEDPFLWAGFVLVE